MSGVTASLISQHGGRHLLPEAGRPDFCLTSAALALFTGELLVGAAFGAIHEEAPENGGTRGFSGSLWGEP